MKTTKGKKGKQGLPPTTQRAGTKDHMIHTIDTNA